MKDLLTPSELIAQVRGLYVRGILTEAERGEGHGGSQVVESILWSVTSRRHPVWGTGSRHKFVRTPPDSFALLELSSNAPLDGLAYLREFRVGNVPVVTGWHDLREPIRFPAHVDLHQSVPLIFRVTWTMLVGSAYPIGCGFRLSIDLKGVRS